MYPHIVFLYETFPAVMSELSNLPYSQKRISTENKLSQPDNYFSEGDAKRALRSYQDDVSVDGVEAVARDFTEGKNIATLGMDASLKKIIAAVFLSTDYLAQFISIYNKAQYGRNLHLIIENQASSVEQFYRAIIKYMPNPWPFKDPPTGEAFIVSLNTLTQDVVAEYARKDIPREYALYNLIEKRFKDELAKTLLFYLKPSQQRTSSVQSIALLQAGDDASTVAYEPNPQQQLALIEQKSEIQRLQSALDAKDRQLVQASSVIQSNTALYQATSDLRSQNSELKNQLVQYQKTQRNIEPLLKFEDDYNRVFNFLRSQPDVPVAFKVGQIPIQDVVVSLLADHRKQVKLLESSEQRFTRLEQEIKTLRDESDKQAESRARVDAEFNSRIQAAIEAKAAVELKNNSLEATLRALNLALVESKSLANILSSETKVAQAETKAAREAEGKVRGELAGLETKIAELTNKLALASSTSSDTTVALSSSQTSLRLAQERDEKSRKELALAETQLRELKEANEEKNKQLVLFDTRVRSVIERDVKNITPDYKRLVVYNPNIAKFALGTPDSQNSTLAALSDAMIKIAAVVADSDKAVKDAEANAEVDRNKAQTDIAARDLLVTAAQAAEFRLKDEAKALRKENDTLRAAPILVPGSSAASATISAAVALVDAPPPADPELGAKEGSALVLVPSPPDLIKADVISTITRTQSFSIVPVAESKQGERVAAGYDVFTDLNELCQDQVMALATIDVLSNKLKNSYNSLSSLTVQLRSFVLDNTPPRASYMFVLDLIIVHNKIKERATRIRAIQSIRDEIFPNQANISYQPAIILAIKEQANLYDTAIQRRLDARAKSNAFWWTDMDSVLTLKKELEDSDIKIRNLDNALRIVLVGTQAVNFQFVYLATRQGGSWIELLRLMCGILWDSDDITRNIQKLVYETGGSLLFYQLSRMARDANTEEYDRNKNLKRVYDAMTRVYNEYGSKKAVPLLKGTVQGNGVQLSIGLKAIETITTVQYLENAMRDERLIKGPRPAQLALQSPLRP